MIWIKGFIIINISGLVFLFSCTEKKATNKDNSGAKIPNSDYIIDYLDPIKNCKNRSTYEVEKVIMEMDSSWRLGVSNSEKNQIDFSLFKILTNNKDTFGFYYGWHPNYPYPIDVYQDDLEEQEFLASHKMINGQFIDTVNAQILVGYNKDSTLRYTNQLMLLTLEALEDRKIWIRQPLKGQQGLIDIAISFTDDDNLKLHLFGSAKNERNDSLLIEIVRSMKLRSNL